MNKKILENITFRTQGFRKNFDLVTKNENIITEYTGVITELKIVEKQPPLVIGEYGFSVWDIQLAKLLNIDIKKLLKAYWVENTYDEFIETITDNDFNYEKYNKIMFIHGLILHPDYRKLQITEEFFEMIYRDFYNDNIAVIALVKPIQNNKTDSEYYYKHKMIRIKKKIGSGNIDNYEEVSALEYYSLNSLIEKEDNEINEYKLFSVAARCGFKRINESHLFIFEPEKIINRIKEKYGESKK